MASGRFVLTAFPRSVYRPRVVELPSSICLRKPIEARKLPDHL